VRSRVILRDGNRMWVQLDLTHLFAGVSSVTAEDSSLQSPPHREPQGSGRDRRVQSETSECDWSHLRWTAGRTRLGVTDPSPVPPGTVLSVHRNAVGVTAPHAGVVSEGRWLR
jgi:hypothetical protein